MPLPLFSSDDDAAVQRAFASTLLAALAILVVVFFFDRPLGFLRAAGIWLIGFLAAYGCAAGLSALRPQGKQPVAEGDAPDEAASTPVASGVSRVAGIVILAISLGLVFASVRGMLNSAPPPEAEVRVKESTALLQELAQQEKGRLEKIATAIGQSGRSAKAPQEQTQLVFRAIAFGADAAWTLNADHSAKLGHMITGYLVQQNSQSATTEPVLPAQMRSLAGGLEVWKADQHRFLGVRVPLEEGFLVVARSLNETTLQHILQAERAEALTAASSRRMVNAQALRFLLLVFALGLLLCETSGETSFVSKWLAFTLSALADRDTEEEHHALPPEDASAEENREERN